MKERNRSCIALSIGSNRPSDTCADRQFSKHTARRTAGAGSLGDRSGRAPAPAPTAIFVHRNVADVMQLIHLTAAVVDACAGRPPLSFVFMRFATTRSPGARPPPPANRFFISDGKNLSPTRPVFANPDSTSTICRLRLEHAPVDRLCPLFSCGSPIRDRLALDRRRRQIRFLISDGKNPFPDADFFGAEKKICP